MGLSERLVTSVTDIRDRGRRLVQLHLELLSSEAKKKGKQFGAAVGLFAGAGLLALYGFGFALATIVVALALVLPLWLSLLIMTAVLFVIVAIMVAVGRNMLQQAKEQAPGMALTEAKKTAELMKTNVQETADGVRARVRRRRPTAGARTAPPRVEGVADPPGWEGRPPEPPSGMGVSDS